VAYGIGFPSATSRLRGVWSKKPSGERRSGGDGHGRIIPQLACGSLRPRGEVARQVIDGAFALRPCFSPEIFFSNSLTNFWTSARTAFSCAAVMGVLVPKAFMIRSVALKFLLRPALNAYPELLFPWFVGAEEESAK
jgi:hypothetical protein